MSAEMIIRMATAASLGGLLLAVGLRLKFDEVAGSVRRSRFLSILALNFVAVPLVCAALVRWGGLGRESVVAMVLLGAAPFAPVVPVFARMARADLALAAGLTTIYPVISAFLTPWICAFLLKRVAGVDGLEFASGQVMLVLVATTSLPLLLGVWVNHAWPGLALRCLRRVEVVSEAAGAFSLGYVTFVEFGSIVGMSGRSVLITIAIFELCVAAGYLLGRERGSRRVVALGTGNRNIALALLVALQSFPSLHVVSAVVGHGLLMIGLGLIHVGCWRLRDWRAKAAPGPT